MHEAETECSPAQGRLVRQEAQETDLAAAQEDFLSAQEVRIACYPHRKPSVIGVHHTWHSFVLHSSSHCAPSTWGDKSVGNSGAGRLVPGLRLKLQTYHQSVHVLVKDGKQASPLPAPWSEDERFQQVLSTQIYLLQPQGSLQISCCGAAKG